MQTRTYGDLFKLIQSLAGVGSFAPTEADDIANLINRRFLQAFNESPIWPRYFVSSEKRDIISLNISGLGAGGSTDSSSVTNGNYILLGQSDDPGAGNGAVIGTNVYYNPAVGTKDSSAVTDTTVIYKRTSTSRWEVESTGLININANGLISVDAGSGDTILVEADTQRKDNPAEVDTWTLTTANLSGTPLVVDKQMIPYAQTGRDTIGSFNRIHRKKAFFNQSAIEYEFFVDFSGANILNITNTTDNSAFVTYKKQFTPFTVPVSNPPVISDYTDSTVEVPAEFFAYIAHASYADFLRMDGQTDKAFAEENTASGALALELEKVDIISNNNTVNKRFSTYVNRQSR
tara:strand:- start:335 stop:1375 length:1041 start_codon:yes stop_codon:yes gene_type:complete